MTFSAGSGDILWLRTLPKDGRAGLGLMIASSSSEGGSSRGAGREVLAAAISCGCSSKLTRTLFLRLDVSPSCEPTSDMVSLSGPAPASGELARIEGDGECFKADLAGETSRPCGSCLVSSVTGLTLNLVERDGESEGLRPLDAGSPRGTSKLDDRWCGFDPTAAYDFGGALDIGWETARNCFAIGCDASACSSASRSSRTTEGCLCRKPAALGEVGLSLPGEYLAGFLGGG